MNHENETAPLTMPSAPSASSSSKKEPKLTREQLLEAMDEVAQLIRDGVIRVPPEANQESTSSNAE